MWEVSPDSLWQKCSTPRAPHSSFSGWPGQKCLPLFYNQPLLSLPPSPSPPIPLVDILCCQLQNCHDQLPSSHLHTRWFDARLIINADKNRWMEITESSPANLVTITINPPLNGDVFHCNDGNDDHKYSFCFKICNYYILDNNHDNIDLIAE